MQYDRPLSFRPEPELREQVLAYAERTGEPCGDVLRRLVREGIDRRMARLRVPQKARGGGDAQAA